MMKKILVLALLATASYDASSQVAPTWPALTGGTNTSATMVCGSGCALSASGSGAISATSVNGNAVPVSSAVLSTNSSAQLVAASVSGTGSVALTTSPTFVTPNLGTPSAITLTSGTGLPITTGVSGLATGISTFLTTPTSANLATAVTNETGSSLLVFNTSPTLVTPNIGAATASGLTLSGITGSTQCLQVNTSGVVAGSAGACGGSLAAQATQTVLGNGSGSSAVPVALTLSGNLVATASGLTTSQAINAQTGTTYTVQTTDAGKLITFSNASAVAVTLPAATTTGFTAGFSFDVQNYGTGTVTITPTTSTINNGATTLAIATNLGGTVTSDGTNYQSSACTACGGGGGGSGTITSSTAGQVPVYTGATTVAGGANFTASAGALSLGVSGTVGTVALHNATSGTVTLGTVTGALGTVTASLPANTGTVAELNLAQTFSALQTFGTNISIGGVTVAGATGTGNNVFATSPTLTTPVLGTPTSVTLTNGLGLPVGGIAAMATKTFVGNVTGSSAIPTAVTSVSYMIDAGTIFTLGTGTGACATSSTLVGGSAVGKFTCTGTTGASTQPIVLPATTTGWVCDFHDITTVANALSQSAFTTTGATMSGTVNASDVVLFKCMGF